MKELICRTCLKTVTNSFNIFEQHKNTKLISEVLAELVNLKIEKDDGLPINICNYCIEKLDVVYDFKMMAIQSRTNFHHMYDSKDSIGSNTNDSADVEYSVTEISVVKNEKTDVLIDIVDNKFIKIEEKNLDIDKVGSEKHHKNGIVSINGRDDINQNSNVDKELDNNDKLRHPDDSFDISEYEHLKKSLSRKEKTKAILHCKICDKKVGFNYYFYKHLRVHMGDLPYECSICTRRFPIPVELKEHIKIKHDETRRFKCDVCEKAFKFLSNLQRHQMLHTDQMYKCEICARSFKCDSYLKSHMKVHQEEGHKNYFCEICGKSVTCANLHKAIHNTVESFTCKQCGKQFKTKKWLSLHEKRHSDVKNHVCSECGKAFKNSRTLKGHMLRHTDKRPFACKVCEKTFKDDGTLYKYMLIHTGERRYSCEKCQKKFRYSQQLKNHIKNHHSSA